MSDLFRYYVCAMCPLSSSQYFHFTRSYMSAYLSSSFSLSPSICLCRPRSVALSLSIPLLLALALSFCMCPSLVCYILASLFTRQPRSLLLFPYPAETCPVLAEAVNKAGVRTGLFCIPVRSACQTKLRVRINVSNNIPLVRIVQPVVLL